MTRGIQGTYTAITVTGIDAQAFVPIPLPPQPPIDWTPELRRKFQQATRLLGKIDGLASILPNPMLFHLMYMQKEALLSSMIEGTKSTFSDVLLSELNPNDKSDELQEVWNYREALNYGREQLENDYPLSLRLLREMHAILLHSGRGGTKSPGEFRRSQNWIGGRTPIEAEFVPPPPHLLEKCLDVFEKFLHSEEGQSDPLTAIALAHVQFETIHPFLDGNGRLGRLLIILLLFEHKFLEAPSLYISLYFKQHRRQYYHLLNRVRTHGDWEAWLGFFADGLIATAEQAIETTTQLKELIENDRKRLISKTGNVASVEEVHRALCEQPVTNATMIGKKINRSPPTIYKALALLEQLGIIKKLTTGKRKRVYSYVKYVDILARGTEPLDD